MHRCPWPKSELDITYHDTEWGVPQHDDRGLFEFLILEGAQAGLSWSTILKKRANYRVALDHFDANRIVRYDQRKVDALLANPGIVRNRLKVNAFIGNAQAYLDLVSAGIAFDDYLWGFTQHNVVRNRRVALRDYPVSTPASDAMAKDLRKRGFRFIGSTICYAFMQATGMVDDHQHSCWVGGELDRA